MSCRVFETECSLSGHIKEFRFLSLRLFFDQDLIVPPFYLRCLERLWHIRHVQYMYHIFESIASVDIASNTVHHCDDILKEKSS